MVNKQPNMQGKESDIASLDVDDNVALQDVETEEEVDFSITDVEDMVIDDSNRDEIYADILQQLKRGVKQQTVTNQLVSKGISRMQAREITEQVWAENAGERKTNAYILFGTATIFFVLGLGILAPSFRAGDVLTLSPGWLLIGLGVYFTYRGYQDYQAA